MVVQAMLRPPFDYILSYDPLLQLTIYPDPLLPFTQKKIAVLCFFLEIVGCSMRNSKGIESVLFDTCI
jgi:hypothetical protein